MIDIASQLNAIHRQVEQQPPADGSGERVSVLLRRSYDAPIGHVWDALTQPDRIKRWFMPISGELRVGGSFQLEGNAGGEILTCEPPRLLRVTFGGPTSIVQVRLTPQGDSDTVLELEHTVPIEIAQSGAGALWVGPGWDGALLGLGLFLRRAARRGHRGLPGTVRSRHGDPTTPARRRLIKRGACRWTLTSAGRCW
jgi:uncharacterized protein YndB with AHSA1/START domain